MKLGSKFYFVENKKYYLEWEITRWLILKKMNGIWHRKTIFSANKDGISMSCNPEEGLYHMIDLRLEDKKYHR